MKKLFYVSIAFFVGQFYLIAQTVTTFTDGTPDDAIALDANGNIYCSNYVGDTVFKFTSTGEMTPFITGLNTPNGLAFNSNQELYVCDGQANTIYKYDIDGNQLASYPAAGHPSGIVKSFNDDSMIFTLYTGNKIMHLETDGSITEISSAPELSGPVGIVYDDNGNLFVGNYNNRMIYKILENGDLEYVAQLPTEGGTFPNLGFITYGQGKLWGTVMGNDKIYSVNPNEVDSYTLFAGSTQGTMDGDISVATFHTPNGILFDEPNDRILITDFGTKNLRIISGVTLGNDNFQWNNTAVAVVPNPVSSTFEIQFKDNVITTFGLKVYDGLGKLILDEENIRPESKIDASSWNNGVYFLKIQTEKGIIQKKIVK
ncbi:MAG: T9SS type A sorting domain-containing protein [Flavobacteriaceae bacterium]